MAYVVKIQVVNPANGDARYVERLIDPATVDAGAMARLGALVRAQVADLAAQTKEAPVL